MATLAIACFDASVRMSKKIVADDASNILTLRRLLDLVYDLLLDCMDNGAVLECAFHACKFIVLTDLSSREEHGVGCANCWYVDGL